MNFLEWSYIFLSLFLVALLMIGIKTSASRYFINPKISSKIMLKVALGLIVWTVYLSIISWQEILFSLDFPPRFPIVIGLPVASFLIWFYHKFKNSGHIHSIPLSWTTSTQAFRVLAELVILYTFLAGITPEITTFHGYNFDIIIGLTAPIVAFLYSKNRIGKNMLRLWNVFGMLMLIAAILIFATAAYFPHVWGSKTSLISNQFFKLPYLLLAGFIAPFGIFIHVVSLCQLSNRKG